MSNEWRAVLLIAGLAGVGLLVLSAAAQLAIAAERADTATNVAEVAAWQVSQVLEDVRRITAESAKRQARGEVL